MPFALFDDQFAHNRKVAQLTDKAFRLHVTMIIECNRHLTDGRVDRLMIDLAPKAPSKGSRAKCIEQLVSAGLWDQNGDEWQIHNFLDWNRSAAEIKEKRRKDRARKRAALAADSARNPDGIRADSTGPLLTSPNLSSDPPLGPPAGGKRKGGSRRKPSKPLPDDWQPNDKLRALAVAEGRHCEREVAKFRGHAQSNDRRCVDWNAAFANWLRSEYGRSQNTAPRYGQAGKQPNRGTEKYSFNILTEDNIDQLLGPECVNET